MKLRKFFIEDRLEKYRFTAECNLGESGIRNKTVASLLNELHLSPECFMDISLADSPNRGSLKLRERIAELYDGILPEQILVTTGTGEALYILFNILLKKGNIVSLFTPAFQALYEVPLGMGCKIQKVSINSKFLWSSLFEKKPDLAIINHPHNPTGVSIRENDITELKKYLESYCGYVLFDEHYRFLDGEDLGFSGAMLNERCIATGSITKCFGVIGLRIGWIVAHQNIIEKARSFKDYLSHTVSPISEYLTTQILENRKEIAKPIRQRLKNNIQYFISKLSKLSSIEGFYPPLGGIVGFAKLKDGILSEQYADNLLRKANIFVLPGSNFEEEGFIRIGFGEDEDRFMAGIDRWIVMEGSSK